jgi:HEAT repeat protein
MQTRRVLWMVAAVVLLALVAMAVPHSPVYLPRMISFTGRYQNGNATGKWLKALDSPDENVRYEAIRALGAIGPDAGEAVPALCVILAKSSRSSRIEAALALRNMVPASESAVPALTLALKDEDPFVRINSMFALMRLGTAARSAIPNLILAMKDENNDTNANAFSCSLQGAAAVALGKVSAGGREGVAALMAGLEAPAPLHLHIAIVHALGYIGPEARPAVPLLKQLAKDKSKELQSSVQIALENIEGERTATN